jgi:hypothetical protein
VERETKKFIFKLSIALIKLAILILILLKLIKAILANDKTANLRKEKEVKENRLEECLNKTERTDFECDSCFHIIYGQENIALILNGH